MMQLFWTQMTLSCFFLSAKQITIQSARVALRSQLSFTSIMLHINCDLSPFSLLHRFKNAWMKWAEKPISVLYDSMTMICY